MIKKTEPVKFEKGQRVWITKWALTNGIKSGTYNGFSCLGSNHFVDVALDDSEENKWMWKKCVHATEEEAKRVANGMVARRIKSLRKQISKLEEMSF